MLTLNDLPSGWKQTKPVSTAPSSDSSDASSSDSGCSAKLDDKKLKPDQQAKTRFAKGAVGVPQLDISIAQLQESKAAAGFKTFKDTLAGCTEYSGTSSDGTPLTGTIKPIDVARPATRPSATRSR